MKPLAAASAPSEPSSDEYTTLSRTPKTLTPPLAPISPPKDLGGGSSPPIPSINSSNPSSQNPRISSQLASPQISSPATRCELVAPQPSTSMESTPKPSRYLGDGAPTHSSSTSTNKSQHSHVTSPPAWPPSSRFTTHASTLPLAKSSRRQQPRHLGHAPLLATLQWAPTTSYGCATWVSIQLS